MPDPTPTPAGHIYGNHARSYLDAGWRGVLPLPPRQKKPVPAGFTGRAGEWPGGPDIWTWMEDHPHGNIAIRLPENVIGIDIDAYPGKPGAVTYANAEHAWGKLPSTWRTTSRDDGVSGIRLFTIPEGLDWPNEVGPGIEVIRYAHRYAIVWPSIHPDTGHTYKWVADDGLTHIGSIPTIDELPPLPTRWIHGLTQGRKDTGQARTPLTTAAAQDALALFDNNTPCRDVQRALTRRLADLTTPGHGARHETMLQGTERLVRLGIEGHHGVPTALHQLRTAFINAVTAERGPGEAEAEWDRSLTGALANAHSVETYDPCTDPFNGLIDRTTTATTNAPTSPQQHIHNADPDNTDTEPGPSWSPVNLTGYIDGTYQPPTPTLFTRTDGHALLYPGLVHDFHGESESGKSLVAQAEVANTLNTGGTAVYVDFESDPGQIIDRLKLMGVTDDTLTRAFTYIRPESSPYAATELEAWTKLLTRPATLVILDGVTDALGQFGGSTKENDDISTWHRMVPRMIATRTGAAVILIDHVTKNTDTRGRFALGGQAKMAAIDGASYTVEVGEPIGKGLAGSVILRIAKDRPGGIRPHCGRWRASDRTQEAARVLIDSTNGNIHVHIQPPTSTVKDTNDDTTDKPYRPTGVMEKLSRLLESMHEPISQNHLLRTYKADGGKAKDAHFYLAVNLLLEGNHAIESVGARSARMLRSSSAYRSINDPESDNYVGGLNDAI